MLVPSRRAFLQAAALAGSLPYRSSAFVLTEPDSSFLDDLSRRAFLYFWEQADPHTGLVLDRAAVDGHQRTSHSLDVASTAATGFALTACCIASQRNWIDPNAARERVRATLRSLAFEQVHQFGWYYHFVNRKSGERVWNCKLSTIDTALLLAGVLTAQQCFAADDEINRLAREIYDRVNFAWMLDEQTGFLRMAWKPESGFLPALWVDYRENVILNILALGCPPHLFRWKHGSASLATRSFSPTLAGWDAGRSSLTNFRKLTLISLICSMAHLTELTISKTLSLPLTLTAPTVSACAVCIPLFRRICGGSRPPIATSVTSLGWLGCPPSAA